MNVMAKRLVSLNLALLLLIVSVQPVLAAEELADWQELGPMVEGGQADFDGNERLAEKELGADASLFADAEAAYAITVDGTEFLSDQDTDGSAVYGGSWEYVAEDHTLLLWDYDGKAIRADGDLDIYSFGTVSVKGGSDGAYGDSGIFVNGLLRLYVPRGSLTVQGGSGTTKGGDAVTSAACICLCYSSATASFTGGMTTASPSDTPKSGGDGVFGRDFVGLMGSGIIATGGYGNILGGCGVISQEVYVNNPFGGMETQYAAVDCTIRGGSGYYGGPGIYFDVLCEFGTANVNVQGGSGIYNYAIQNADRKTWYVSQHTTSSGSIYSSSVSIRVKQYTLLLRGNGGYRGGASSTSLTGYYPSTYCLADYQFQQNNYTQVGWSARATGSDLQPLNLLITPTTPTSLYARWVSTGSGDILLNGLSGKLDNGMYYQKSSNVPVMLPDRLTYRNGSEAVLGWCTEVNATPSDRDDVYSGQWYSGGDIIAPDSSAPVVLYAHPREGGQYAVYHPTQGTVANGGTIIVQGTVSTQSDLTVYTPDGSALTAPTGCEFAGWSATEGGQTVDFDAGASLPLSPGTVRHLYAVWEPAGYAFQPEDGITVVSRPDIKTVRVTATSAWHEAHGAAAVICALYDDRGKMTACARTDCASGEDTVTKLTYPGGIPPVCKVFALDAGGRPVFAGVTCDLPSLSSGGGAADGG